MSVQGRVYGARMSGSLGRVLVVDDDDVIRQLITVNLELEGFEVETAHDGQDCLDKVKDVAPDVVTLDIMSTCGTYKWFTTHR